jgi:outer membrane receptor protein involved in Fe transport
MRLILIITLFISFLFTSVIFAQQKGTISGSTTDKTNNEVLIGTNVSIMGTDFGAASDLDGHYFIRNILPGTYRLKFSFISYQTIIIGNVVVTAGNDTKINVALPPLALETKEVVVTAEALKTSEFSVLNIQKNSSNILDGISAELINKNNSSDGTDVLKRMTGITISDGRYAYIRGVSDRYNNTLLNGSSLPSTDPEKKSFSYDLFPANLIENLISSKTATPDKPADFSGGLIEIQTIEFPSKLIMNFSASSSYNSQTSFKDFVSYNGGNRDWSGMDDGARLLPSSINWQKVGRGNYTSEELQSIGLAFANNWQTNSTTAPIKGNFKINLGNSYNFSKGVLGFITSFNYSNNDEITKLENNYYTFDGPRFEYKGFNYANAVAWNGMLNLSLKLGQSHKVSLKNIYNQNMENETTLFEGPSYYFPDYRKSTSLRFISRALFSTQFIGEHHFGLLKGLSADWNLNYGNSKRDEPDARRYVYSRDLYEPESAFRFLLDQSLSTRFYGNLDDTNLGASMNLGMKLFKNPSLPDVKFGFHYDKKERTFDARTFGFWNVPGGNFMAEDQLMTKSVEEIFAPQNFGNRFIEVIEITKASDSYNSKQFVTSGYLMTHFTLFSDLKVITGVRYEKSEQKLNSYTVTNEPMSVNSTYNDVLPSLNLAYAFTEKLNIRAAFSKTLARPEFRELAPFSYFDFLTYELVEGNPELKRSLITNLDLRFEYYPSNLELLAVSGFYKKFDDPIEQVLIAASAFQPIRSYENAKEATNFGLEVEIKKRLDFISPYLNCISFVGNVSLINSEISLNGGNGFQVTKRPLQGQADYISNFGLYYEDISGKWGASLIYNRVGEKISRVGFANLGDIIELPRNQIDFSGSAKLFENITLKLSAKDLLNQDHKFIQRAPEGDKTAELRTTGRVVSLGLTYQL